MAKLRKYGTTTRTERRREAEVRQESYNTLTPQQKLDKLPPTGSKKQRAKHVWIIAEMNLCLKFGNGKINMAMKYTNKYDDWDVVSIGPAMRLQWIKHDVLQ